MAGILLDNFVKKYEGKKVDFDGAFGAQCVDLARQYWKEGLGIPEHTGPCSTTGGAKDLYLDYEKKCQLKRNIFIRFQKAKGLQQVTLLFGIQQKQINMVTLQFILEH